MLLRERDALSQYLAAPGPLVPFDAFVVVIRGDMLQVVLDRVLPVTRPVDESIVLTLRAAQVRFRSGLGLVELDGRAALRDNPNVFVDLRVSGAFEVLGVDPNRGTLSTRVEVLGFETANVGLAGLSPPAERLVDALAARRAESLNEVLRQLTIPVRLTESLTLPRVDEAEVTIEAGSVDFELEVRDVKVLEDRLWIAVAGDLSARAPLAGLEPDLSE